MKYRYPFGEYVRPLVQQDQTPKEAFVLGVYASAVHARWTREGRPYARLWRWPASQGYSGMAIRTSPGDSQRNTCLRRPWQAGASGQAS